MIKSRKAGARADIFRKSSRATQSYLRQMKRSIGPGFILSSSDAVFLKGRGCYVTDIDGRVFIDATSGGYTANVGHSHPRVVAAIRTQLTKMMSPHPRPQEIHLELAEKLKQIAPGSLSHGLVGFCNSGSASMEFSMQTVRAYTGRPFFVAFTGAFHGVSTAALSLTTASAGIRRNLPSNVSNVVYAPFPNSPANATAISGDDGSACLDQLRMIFSTTVDPHLVAAVYTEPIQVHAGVIVPPDGFFKKLMRLCHEFGILLVDDEAITGFGRTGRMFGLEHWEVTPDIMCLAKPFAAGLPLGAVLGRKRVMKHYPAAGGGTFSGSVIAFAAAIANIDVIIQEHLMENSNHVGSYLIKRLSELSERDERIAEVRGRGLLIGVQLTEDDGRPARRLAHDVVRGCFKRGLLILSTGINGDVLRITPPLTFTTALADRTVESIANSLRDS